jgi:16S rRNA U516 pseudouridylate synthase RsuA-like enzyme
MYHKPANVITSHSNSDEIAKSQSEKSRRTVYENIYSMQGFVSDQPKGNNDNFESATSIRSKLHAIGRLDADTTGLLLLTNDGTLVHQVTNPTAKQDNYEGNNGPVKKTYQALIMGHHELPSHATTAPPNNTTYPLLKLLKEGVTLSQKHGGQTKPVDDLKILSYPTATTTLVSITISQGKNRQIRRMFHSVGSGVMKLHRVSVGKLTLSGLDSNPKTGLQEGEWRILSEDEIRLGLGWKCRWIDKVQTDKSRSARMNSGKRKLNTRKNTRRRNKR